ncbi:MAG TPA: MerR family transcriptional regulator [Candidatus Binatia bacterium]|nr:MerR family transcriptional regulator [Candidatus Binatia bacterium]
MYTIKEAAARAGLTPALLRAWERRYGVVRPARSPSGYRLYDEAAVARLRLMRRLVEEGWLPSEAARVIDAGEVPEPSQPEPSQTEPATVTGEPASGRGGASEPVSAVARERAELVERFVLAAARHDEAEVEAILDEIGARGRFEAIVDDLLLPAAAALGDAWASGRLDAAAEHAASAAVHRRLAAAFQAAAAPSEGRPLLVGLPPGSRHELGALAFAVAARRLGMPVRYLGPDLPVSSWLEATRATNAWLVVLGVVSPADREPALEVARALAAAAPDVAVAMGGAAAPDPPDQAAGRTWIRLPERVTEAARFVAALRRRISEAEG